MKHFIILLFFVITFNLNAQDDSYTELTTVQITKTTEISETKLSTKVKFESGMDYDGTFFWNVTSPDGKEYYFNSSATFTDIKFEEATYSSLMEYVIENIGF